MQPPVEGTSVVKASGWWSQTGPTTKQTMPLNEAIFREVREKAEFPPAGTILLRGCVLSGGLTSPPGTRRGWRDGCVTCRG